MHTLQELQRGQYYHIYNRGNNQQDIFIEPRNYAYFLSLYTRHVEPVADTFAYCLMPNHFHLLVRIREIAADEVPPSKHFANLFNAYAKAINKGYQRTGSLFQKRFGRQAVTSDRYFLALIAYIHRNPQKHGFTGDFRNYPHSSYHSLLSHQPTRLNRQAVLEWFGTRADFEEFHRREPPLESIAHLVNAAEA